MEESELISSEPTPSFDSLLEELGMGTIEVSTDASETAAIFSDDEAAAILNGGKTRALPGTKNQGAKRLPSNSPVVIDHDDAGNEIIELPRDLGNSTSKELPRRKPRDSQNSPDPTNGEWEVINKRNRRSHKTSTPKTPQRAAAFEDPIRETSYQTTHQAKGIEWVFVTISLVARSAFPIGKVKQTVEKFHKYLGKDHCNGVYPPNFRMGPTIKINKTQIAKAKYFTMPDIGDLIFQINHFNPFGQNQKNEKNKRQPKINKPRDNKSIGVVNGISTEHDLKKTFTTEENKINKIERVTTKLGKITNSIKITFASAIAPLKIGLVSSMWSHCITNLLDATNAKDSGIQQKNAELKNLDAPTVQKITPTRSVAGKWQLSAPTVGLTNTEQPSADALSQLGISTKSKTKIILLRKSTEKESGLNNKMLVKNAPKRLTKLISKRKTQNRPRKKQPNQKPQNKTLRKPEEAGTLV